MSKIGIIIGHEYKTRVVKKSFIILTFLTPVLIAFISLMPALMMLMDDSSQKNIYVIDNVGLYSDVLKSNDKYTFTFVEQTLEAVKQQAKDNDAISALLLINADLAINPKGVSIYSEQQIDMETKSYIAKLLNKDTENRKIAAYNIPDLKEMVEKAKTEIEIQTVKWSEGEDKIGSSELAFVIGLISTFLIYFFIMMYGGQVMSGVVREKSSRIVEVIISSVKPFELMMGKIVAIALVGLTQILMWAILAGILIAVGMQFLLPSDAFNPEALQQMQQVGGQALTADQMPMMQEIIGSLQGFNFLEIFGCLVLYFIGGYLLYASFFAAIGAAVDSETDTQQFMMPITLPIIFAFILGFYASQHPDAALSFWASMVPFTSPVVMMARLPFGVPTWQIVLSIVILYLSFVGSTWLAGKIYRTGILMYGKKVTWKEMWKWLRY